MAWCVTDSKVRRLLFEMSILLKGFSMHLKTLTVLSNQKNCLAMRVAGQFLFNYQHANKRVKERCQRWCPFGTAKCKQWGNTGYDITLLLSSLWNDHKGQKTGINISICVVVGRSGFPEEISLAFIVIVCIVAGLYAMLFSASFASSITSCMQLALQVTSIPSCFSLWNVYFQQK